MNTHQDQNNPGLNPGDHIGGYVLRRMAELKDIAAFFYEFEHAKTGTRHIHISSPDTENTFGVVFKTVPSDSTGVAHILEHTVLCGSKKFPVRDPFFSMIKRSLNTFMNAFTASDWTMYPFASQNRKDFYNLMDVYLDAAFFPRLDRLNFRQEGHRIEPEGEKLVYKGVVYNEMKGAMSSPSQVMGRALMKALFPDTTYGNNSGGEPSDIPRLTHEQLVAFHRRHYHPSNAWFYTYGNLPLKEHLAFIESRVLDGFDRIDPQTDVPNQPRWNKPRIVTCPYPLDPGEDTAKKSQACVAWMTADVQETFEVLSLSLLGEILIGNSASPVRKALMDSGLGRALADSTGFEPDIRDTFFACGLKDMDDTDAEKVEQIIFETLRNLVKDGVDRELVDAAIHQMEFHRKEITNSPYPYGLKLLLGLGGIWIHGGDPLRILKFDEDMQKIRDAVEKGRFFENQIRKYLLENPHRVLFRLVPDQEMAHKEEQRTADELENIRVKMTPEEIKAIRADAEVLEALQEAPEDLSVLPTLELTDIPPLTQSVLPSEPAGVVPVETLWYDQPTSGIFYFTAALGLGHLPERLMPLVPFFCHAFDKSGTALHDYTEMARRIDLYAGGIGIMPHNRNRYDGAGTCLPFATFSGKCLNRNQEKLFDILAELTGHTGFTDMARLKTLLMEYRASLDASVVQNGHGLAISLASRNFMSSRQLGEMWRGVHQIRRVKELTDNLTDATLEALAADLRTIGKHLFVQKNMRIALVGEADALSAATAPVSSMIKALQPGTGDGFIAPQIQAGTGLPREGWSTSTAVSFVARAFETVRMDHADAPALSVLAKMMRSLYLHREIREKGGAYGGFSMYNSEDGLFCLGSYRDPHIVNTLKVYDGAGDFIRSGDYADEDVKEAILQVCSDIDHPDPPAPAARKAFYRQLVGLSDEARNRHKEGLLTLKRKDIMAAAEKYFSADRDKQAEAVISSEDKLKAANEKLGDRALTLYRI